MTSLVEEERGEESVLKISVETWRSGQQYLWRKQTEPINVPQATQRIIVPWATHTCGVGPPYPNDLPIPNNRIEAIRCYIRHNLPREARMIVMIRRLSHINRR